MGRKGEGDCCKLGISYESSPMVITLCMVFLCFGKRGPWLQRVRDSGDNFENPGLTSELDFVVTQPIALQGNFYYPTTSIGLV